FRLPWATRKRGDSGMSNTPARNATDGTASIQNIQRHAGAPSQKVAPAPPANRARMSLLKKAQNNPDTIAICCSDASRPRICGGATSAIYIGASTLAAPLAGPPTSREPRRNLADPASPVAMARARTGTAFSRIAGPGSGIRGWSCQALPLQTTVHVSKVDSDLKSGHEGVGNSPRPAGADDVLEVGLEEERVVAEPKPIGQLERHLVSLHSDGGPGLPRAPLRVLQIIAEVAVHDGDPTHVRRP